jgi:hypothetical protein
MRKISVYGVVAALVVSILVPDASACRRRRHSSCSCPCQQACCGPSKDVTVVLNASPWTGGHGTYTTPDNTITGVYYERKSDGMKYPCQFRVNLTKDGTWQTTQVPPLPMGFQYRLCAKGDVTPAAKCSAYFNY